ncbi:MAG: TadE/TadG family type IV pilus assembly protein, partial [Paracoccaceae bacterium]
MKQLFARAIRFLKTEQNGSMSIEAVLAVPMLFWVATATFTFFDAFKAQNTSYRANYTISDMLSRQTDAVDQAYIDGLSKVFRYMTHSGPETSWIRVSVLRCKNDCADEAIRDLAFDWSSSTDGARLLTDADLEFYKTKIPLMAKG